MNDKPVYFLGLCIVVAASILSYGIIEASKFYSTTTNSWYEIVSGGEKTAYILDKISGEVKFAHPDGIREFPSSN